MHDVLPDHWCCAHPVPGLCRFLPVSESARAHCGGGGSRAAGSRKRRSRETNAFNIRDKIIKRHKHSHHTELTAFLCMDVISNKQTNPAELHFRFSCSILLSFGKKGWRLTNMFRFPKTPNFRNSDMKPRPLESNWLFCEKERECYWSRADSARMRRRRGENPR